MLVTLPLVEQMTDRHWKQGQSHDNSFIFVTTEYLTATQLDDIARDLPEFERLLICAPAFDIGLGKRYDNIDVRTARTR